VEEEREMKKIAREEEKRWKTLEREAKKAEADKQRKSKASTRKWSVKSLASNSKWQRIVGDDTDGECEESGLQHREISESECATALVSGKRMMLMNS